MTIDDGERPPAGGDEDRPTNRVRQGVTGHNVHRVLVFGLIGVLLAYLVLFFVR